MFVSDRKIDEELSRTTRFTCDMDHMLEVSEDMKILIILSLSRDGCICRAC